MGRTVIVGAGPGGATLGYLLARSGVEVTLVERQDDFSREFRGEVLLPSGLEPFDQMGLWDALESLPHVKLGGATFYLNGRRRFAVTFRPEDLGRYFPRWISQPALLEMIVARGAEHAGFRLLRDTAVRDLVWHEGRCVGVQARGPEGDLELEADLVVGADGRTSVVRRRAELTAHEDPTPMDVVWLKLPPLARLQEQPCINACLGSGHLMIVAPVYDDLLQIGWIIPKGRYGEIRRRGIPECLDDMADHAWPELAEHIRRHREAAVRPFLLSTVSDHVTQWTRPGVMVIGDAAHTMSPVGGQGVNIAIRDAVVAANRLVPALREGRSAPEAVDAAARAVEGDRRGEVERVQRIQAAPPKLFFRDAGWVDPLLGLLMAIPAAMPASWLGRMAGSVARGASGVKLEVGPTDRG